MEFFLNSKKEKLNILGFNRWAENNLNEKVDFHLHTQFTDGQSSVLAMVEAAVEKDIKKILFCEHIRSTSTYFYQYRQKILSAAKEAIEVFTGIETKIISFDGSLDYDPSIARYCDAIVGSVHRPIMFDGTIANWANFSPEEALNLEYLLSMAIIEKSSATILGHPLGMSISKFMLNPIDQLLDLAKACAKNDIVFEMNPRYCIKPGILIDIVKEAKCKISLGSDAHSTQEIGRAWKVFIDGG